MASAPPSAPFWLAPELDEPDLSDEPDALSCAELDGLSCAELDALSSAARAASGIAKAAATAAAISVFSFIGSPRGFRELQPSLAAIFVPRDREHAFIS